MQCSHCHTANPDDNLFCEDCGARLADETSAVPQSCSCGALYSEMDEDGFCSACGRRLKRPDADHIELALLHDLAGVSDRGLKHNRNEDRFTLAMSGDAYALVVCDGVSMSPDADQAASSAAECMLAALNDGLAKQEVEEVNLLRHSIRSAADCVSNLRKQVSESPSTTLVASIVKQNKVTVAWIGDSRAYWFSNGEARQLTQDHSWQNSPAALRAVAEEKTANAHALTRWVGADAPDLEPEIVQTELHSEGLLLLCSDGLWNYAASAENMAALLSAATKPGASALSMSRELVEYAISRGGHDNITALVLRHPVSEDRSYGG